VELRVKWIDEIVFRNGENSARYPKHRRSLFIEPARADIPRLIPMREGIPTLRELRLLNSLKVLIWIDLKWDKQVLLPRATS
jgi:hypothetical protein